MAFETKSLKDLVNASENALSVQFYGTSQILRKSVLKVLASVFGGLLYLMELMASRIWKDRFVSTCNDDCLDGFGVEYGISHKAPLYARGKVLIKANKEVSVNAGEVLIDEKTKKEYEILESVKILENQEKEISVTALEYGKESNIDAEIELKFRDGDKDGVEKIYSLGIKGGASFDVEIDGENQVWGETSEDYRKRLLNRIQNPPAGGAKNDWYQWAMHFDFVSDVFVYPNQPNTNSVSVVIANYNTNEISNTDGQVEEVKKYLSDDIRRPITSDVRVFTVKKTDVEICLSISPFNDSVKKSVESAVKEFVRKIEPSNKATRDELTIAILANSQAKTCKISDIRKNKISVSELKMELDSEYEYAEVGNVILNLQNGDT